MKSPLARRLAADRSRLVDLARRVVRSPDDAEDVVHDVYVRIEATPAAAESPDAWLTTAVRHAAIDRVRRRERERRLAPAVRTSLDPTRSAEAESIASQDLEVALATLLARLDVPTAALWLLREVFAVDHATLARALDVGEAGARQATRRARQRLADAPARSARNSEEDEDFAAICRHALASGDAGALYALLVRRPRAAAPTIAYTALARASGPAQRATPQLVRVGDRYAIALVFDGVILCAVPVGVDERAELQL